VVVDAADSVSDKAAIIDACRRYNFPVITTGGVGGLTDPTLLRVSDLSATTGDNLMKLVRKKLRQKYGYPGVENSSKKSDFPEHKLARAAWGIPSVHTLPIGTTRSFPAITCDNAPVTDDFESAGNSSNLTEPKVKKTVSRKDGGFRKCDTNFGTACFATVFSACPVPFLMSMFLMLFLLAGSSRLCNGVGCHQTDCDRLLHEA
jgi:hypothetical protein